MGIHNSSYLSIVWRVANHNMKAFVTICALMAGSASAESQHMVSFSQPLAIPANPLTPYSVYSPPLHPVSFGNLQVPQVPLQVEPLSYKLPKITKCTFHKYGASGTVEKKDGLCVLPQNIINEKIFLFIWIWLVFVAVVTGMFLLYRIATLAGGKLRVAL